MGDKMARTNGTNRLRKSNTAQIISNVLITINKYSNLNNDIAAGLVAVNGWSPKISK
jgi:hypothetical protein